MPTFSFATCPQLPVLDAVGMRTAASGGPAVLMFEGVETGGR